MSKNWNDITVALAGVFQAANLVEQLANTGHCDNQTLGWTLDSLFVTDPDSTLAVYGNDLHHVQRGLECLRDSFFQRGNSRDSHTLRYVLSLLHLQKKLRGRKDMLNVIGSRLEQAGQQAEHFGSNTHENVIANLASIYSDTISTFQFRIQVMGNFTYLQQEHTANQIRALLLAGIRSAVLWRQVGGTGLQLFTSRKRMAQVADDLRRQV